MDLSLQNKIVSFIWSIADDCLRDVYVRGKYRDVILPMFVLRRLDCLLESTKADVLEEVRFQREEAGLTILDSSGLQEASGYVFYNVSEWTLKKLVKTAANNRQILAANFKAYLDGFSDNVKEIISKFELRNQIRRMVEADVLHDVLEKFTSTDINLSPHEIVDSKGEKLPGLSNLGMGYVFEELIRKFNEENNEEAGEHFTPREVIKLMIHLLFIPIKDELPPVITVYDGACGSGGMLTESQGFIEAAEGEINSQSKVYLYGKEVNGETYAICKSDMMIKGNDPENIKFGSTLATDDFQEMRFDFMLSNPPYGKSYKSDQKYILDGKEVLDPRFQVELQNFQGQLETLPAIPRSSDGQLLFLMDMVGKMKRLNDSPLGSRIASIHNGSALFTGDAGSGESNIRRWIIENDWLECIVGLPLNMFYNTGIATYIWVLSNRKPEKRRGKVQLIDATEWYGKLRKNLGKKNCELTPENIQQITETFLRFEETAESKIFDNQDFGYHKITVERPLRLSFQVAPERVEQFGSLAHDKLYPVLGILKDLFGDDVYQDFNLVKQKLEKALKAEGFKLAAKDLKLVYDTFTEKDETAEAVIKKKTKAGVVYESDSELRDTENVPLKEDIQEYFNREVLPHVPDAWIDFEKTVRGYEISFTKYFYKFQPLRSLADIAADILALEAETEGVLKAVIGV